MREIENRADALNITPEQISSLKAISPATDMPVSAPDKERLRSLFEDIPAFSAASRSMCLSAAAAALLRKSQRRTIVESKER